MKKDDIVFVKTSQRIGTITDVLRGPQNVPIYEVTVALDISYHVAGNLEVITS